MTNEDTIAHFKRTAPVKDTSLSPVINISHNEVDTMFFLYTCVLNLYKFLKYATTSEGNGDMHSVNYIRIWGAS